LGGEPAFPKLQILDEIFSQKTVTSQRPNSCNVPATVEFRACTTLPTLFAYQSTYLK